MPSTLPTAARSKWAPSWTSRWRPRKPGGDRRSLRFGGGTEEERLLAHHLRIERELVELQAAEQGLHPRPAGGLHVTGTVQRDGAVVVEEHHVAVRGRRPLRAGVGDGARQRQRSRPRPHVDQQRTLSFLQPPEEHEGRYLELGIEL